MTNPYASSFSDLPLECLALIIDHVGLRELYPLLTVNKAFFKVVAQKLYQDPIKTIRSFPDKVPEVRALRKLFSLIVCTMPASVAEVVFATGANIDKDVLPLGKPYIDYMALIQSMSLKHNYLLYIEAIAGKEIPNIYYEGNHDLANHLYLLSDWMRLMYVVPFGCRFPTLQHLDVPCSGIQHYWPYMSHMLKVEMVHFGLTGCSLKGDETQWQYKLPMDSPVNKGLIARLELELREATAFFQALNAIQRQQRHQNPQCQQNQYQDQSLSFSLPLVKPLDAKLIGYVPPQYFSSIVLLLRNFYQLLPIIRVRTVSGVNRVSRDYGNLDDIIWHRFYALPSSFDLSTIENLTPWEESYHRVDMPWPPYQDIAAILQQCRSLKHLSLNMDLLSEHVLEWAAHENLFGGVDGGGSFREVHTVAITAPIRKVRPVTLQRLNLTGSHARPLRKILLDASVAFPGLCFLKIIWRQTDVLQLTKLLAFPNLTDLVVECLNGNVQWSTALFEHLPYLRHLTIRSDLGDSVGDNCLDPWLSLGRLEKLQLMGGVTRLFHPQTIASMRQLRDLDIYDDVDGSMPFWHQDWEFPNLERLWLGGVALLGFQVFMISSKRCPHLRQLSLHGPEFLDDEMTLSAMAPFGSLPSVTTLAIHQLRPTLKGFEPLLKAHFPNLQDFATDGLHLRGAALREKFYR